MAYSSASWLPVPGGSAPPYAVVPSHAPHAAARSPVVCSPHASASSLLPSTAYAYRIPYRRSMASPMAAARFVFAASMLRRSFGSMLMSMRLSVARIDSRCSISRCRTQRRSVGLARIATRCSGVSVSQYSTCSYRASSSARSFSCRSRLCACASDPSSACSASVVASRAALSLFAASATLARFARSACAAATWAAACCRAVSRSASSSLSSCSRAARYASVMLASSPSVPFRRASSARAF